MRTRAVDDGNDDVEDGVMTRAVRGAAAGLVATVAMTPVLAMQTEASDRGLGPKRVTEGLARLAGLTPADPVLDAATTVNHLAYGSSMGALYAVLRGPRRRRASPTAAGILYGIALWVVSYAGWIPASGIMPPPRRDDAGRVVPIHLAHWVYGACLGRLEARWRRTR